MSRYKTMIRRTPLLVFFFTKVYYLHKKEMNVVDAVLKTCRYICKDAIHLDSQTNKNISGEGVFANAFVCMFPFSFFK